MVTRRVAGAIVIVGLLAALFVGVCYFESSRGQPDYGGQPDEAQQVDSTPTDEVPNPSGEEKAAEPRTPLLADPQLCLIDSITLGPVTNALCAESGGSKLAASDAAGCIREEWVRHADRILIRHPSYEVVSVSSERIIAPEPIRLLPLGRLAGHVVSGEGGQADIIVTGELDGDSSIAPATSASPSDGHFEFSSLPSGVYCVRAATVGGYQGTVQGIRVHPGSSTDVKIELDPPVEIEGTIVYADNREPAVGVAFCVLPLRTTDQRLLATAASDAAGHFVLRTYSGEVCNMSVTPPGSVPFLRVVTIPASKHHVKLDLQLSRPVYIKGRVLFDDGPARGGVQVFAARDDTRRNFSLAWDGMEGAHSKPQDWRLTRCITNERGEYAFSINADPAQALCIVASPPRELRSQWCASGREGVLLTVDGDSATVADLVLPRASPFAGVVVSDEGDPIAGAEIHLVLRWSDKPYYSTSSREDGTFEISAPSDVSQVLQSYELRVAHPGFKTRGMPLLKDTKIVMRSLSRRVGELITADGIALCGQPISITVRGTSGMSAHVPPSQCIEVTDEAGLFRLPEDADPAGIVMSRGGWVIRSREWRPSKEGQRLRLVVAPES